MLRKLGGFILIKMNASKTEKLGILARFRKWICKKFGHSFSDLSILLFNIEREGRCFSMNALTGERSPILRATEITCRRCGAVFEPK